MCEEREDSTDEKLSPESLYSLRLEEWSLQIPLIRLSADWERSILDLIPIHLRQRHPRRVEMTLVEIRDIYESDIRKCAVRSIIPMCESTALEMTKREFGLRGTERTEDGCSVPRLRVVFAKKYFLSHPIMKHIIETAIRLPRLIVDVGEYRGDNFFEISELQEALTCSVDRAAAIIRQDYYGEIAKSISSHLRRYARTSRSVRRARLMDCAKNLFAQQILRIMMSTIDELTAALADYRHRCPQLNVRLVWTDGRISTEPTLHQVYSLWHNLVDSIERIAENFPTFERVNLSSGNVGKVLQEDYLKVTLPKWYLDRSHSKVDEALALALGPLEKYFEKIVETFGEVSSREAMRNIRELVSKGRHFDVYCCHAKDLSVHYARANDLIDNLYYDIGRLNQTSARIRLRCHIAEMRGILIEKLLLHHREYNEEICREFHGIEREMLDIPRDARALFELSERISRASRIHVDTLERRVKKSIEMLSSLLELTIDMTESHMKLNSRTINWLAEIQPIFTRSNTLCEAMKSELEDELQRRINNLNVEIDAVIPKFVILDDMDDAARVDDYAEHLAVLVGHVDELDAQIQRINFEERLFKFPETSFSNVDEIREILSPVNRLNGLTCDWRRDHAVWLDGPFEYIDAQQVGRKTVDYRERFEKLNSSLRAKIKLDIQSSASKPFRYSGVVDDPDPMQQPAPVKLCWQVLADVESFERHLELVECVCNPALRERHWDEMAMIREQGGGDPDSLRFTPNAGTTLRKLIALDLQKDIEKYQVVSIGANKELALARRLRDMVDQWDTVDFSIVHSKKAEESKLGSPTLETLIMMKKTFARLDDIEILMEEHSIVIAEMKVSYFVKPVESALMELSSSLRRVGDTMQQFLGVQDEWFDLETVFRDGDTDRIWEHEKLGDASVIFFGVHAALRRVNEEIMVEPKFQPISNKSEKLLQILGAAGEQLEIVKETVRNYIREVRILFPRFYFLSDREVVRIVFEPIFFLKMRLLLNKCFSDIRSLRIARTTNDCARVVAIIDSHDQELRLKKTTRRGSGQIQDEALCSFVATEKAIISAVRESILQCSIELTESCELPSLISRHKQLLMCDDTPGMSSLCASRIYWTCRTEEAFESRQRQTLMSSLQDELTCKLKSSIADLRLKMSRKQRKKLVALIVQTRDQVDITKLVSNTVRSPQDFNWKAQIRHYWLDNDVKVVILDTESKYGYEYNACEKPQVITPLTERCQRSVMEAHRNGLCGVLFGPTGASKTRCIRDLARTLAVRFYVYNCHENIVNYSEIENIFRGLTGCSPCWLFFKHLDLLNVHMQSTIAQRISLVSRNYSGSNGPGAVNFRGANGNFRVHGTFVAGTISTKYSRKFNRQGLTDSLKILFRPVAMTHPDTRRIIEVELFAEGFVDAAKLAGKIRLVEKHSRDQMSSKFDFRDFSIRSTKSVIHTACALKNRYPEQDEDTLILRALVDVHLPKFHRSADIRIFQRIIENVFPGVALPSPDYSTLLSGLEEIRRVECPTDLTEEPLYDLKIIQLFEMLFFRHSIVIVGPQLSGKTSVIENLGKTLSLLNRRKSVHSSPESGKQPSLDVFPAVESVRLNHAALALEEMFGWYQNDSGRAKLSWKDGILTRTLRSFAERKPKLMQFQMQWLILDGPLDDSMFLEKLGTLLDDNKTLFLSSNERIPLNDSTSIIIETTSLKKASPATVSRCGVIHIDEATIGWRGLSRRWISEVRALLPVRSDDERDYRVDYVKFLESVIEWSVDATLDFAWSRLSARVRPLTNRSHLVTSVLRILEMHLRDAILDTGESSSEAKEPPKWTVGNLYLWTQAALLMALVWGLGGALDREARVALDEFCTTTWRTGLSNPTIPRPEILKTYELFLPPQGMIQDHVYVFSGTGNWRHWSDVLKKANGVSSDAEKSSRNRKASETCYVPTIDSIKYTNLFETHVKHRKPFIVLGEMATGKTLYMRHLLKSRCRSTCSSNFLSLGFAGPGYKSSRARRMFLAKMSKVKRGVYGPGSSRLCVNFIDDLNIVLSSKGQGDQAALELIRQYHDDYHWFDIETGERITLLDVMFLGAITLDCSNEWNDKWREPRFFRHFNLYDVERPSNESIFRIYSNVLFSNLRTNRFNADVTGSVNSMVNATVDLYTSLRRTLRPVPSKFQYRFTLRDVGRVVTGCSFVHKESVETKTTFLRLWVHEALRVFADRIVDLEDSEFVFLKIREAVGSHFKDSFEAAFDHLKNDPDQPLNRENFQHLVFSDFMQLDVDPETVQAQLNGDEINGVNGPSNRRRYEEVACSREALRNKAMSYLSRYNESVTEARKKLDVHMLPGMLEHLIRICRVLSIPGGSLLMICFGGTGRRSLTTLASHLKGHALHELSRPVPSSSGKPWRSDLKRGCMSCTAGPGQSRATDCTFFVTDRQITESPPSLLRDVCSLMKTGQIPGLFTTDERETIVERSRLLAQNGDRNLEMSSLDVIDYFYDRCQEKLHFVLYFERAFGRTRSGHYRPSFRDSIFNSIVSHCSVDCYENWPDESFTEIARTFVKDVNVAPDTVRSRAIEASKYFYDSVDSWRGKQSSDRDFPDNKRGSKLPVAAYLHMVKLYGLLIGKRQSEIRAARKRYLGGLEKLQLAGEEVKEMKRILTRLRPQLEQSAEETAATMRKIERENVSVENATIQVKREEEVANGIAKVAGILKEECEADLAVAIPILEDAIAALNTLKPTDITLVKAMKNPPDTVKLVLAAVCVMLNVPPDRSVDPVTGKKSIDYWAPSKRILGDMNFLQSLKDYDKDNIAPTVMVIINKTYMNDDTFQPHIVAKASSAAEGLCKWVRAMVSYDEVAKVVAPKKEKLGGAERECNASLEYLNQKRKSLAALNDKLAALNATLEATLAKKLQLEKQVENCTAKLAKAEGLITSLAGEKDKWLRSADTLTKSYDCLAGDILLSCGVIALLGTFDAVHRAMHVDDWLCQLRRLEVPTSGSAYDFVGSLESESVVNNWKQAGLSNNSFSHGNAAIVKNSLLWPVFLDPENQANTWIRRLEAGNRITVVKATDPHWLDEIERCVDLDRPVLVENLERSRYFESTVLDYILARLCPSANCRSSGPERCRSTETTASRSPQPGIRSRNFRFYVTISVSLHEAALESHVYKRMSVVNFALADEALEDRLLDIVVSREEPELQDTFDRITTASASNERALKDEEDKILAILSGASSGNIVEDERAIEALDCSRNLSLEIKRREEAARETARTMDEFRATYRPLVKYCASLYNTVAGIANLSHMYRFSLDWFTRLYVRSIDESMKSVVRKKRLRYLRRSFTEILHSSVRNGLLGPHKLVYSFLLAIKILLDSKRVSQDELRFLRDSGSERLRRISRNSGEVSSFGSRLAAVEDLSRILPSVFQDLPTSFRENPAVWETYCDGGGEETTTTTLPAPWNELSEFQRLILAITLRPGRSLATITSLVEKTLETSLTSLAPYSVARCYEESSCLIPLIFILPSYLEASAIVAKWARIAGYASKVSRFDVGAVNDEATDRSIDGAIARRREQGGWILLENCHLATDQWLAKVEKICESLDPSNTVLGFRLWLTSYPSHRFPIRILQNSVKIHWEGPEDRIKESLLRSYQSEPLDEPDFYDACPGKNRAFAKLIYGLCFFHAVVRGRCKFGKRAWNVRYEFADSDLKMSIGQLRNFLNGSSGDRATVPEDFQTLEYLVGECYYGGRILDSVDRLRLKTLLRDYCNPDIVRSSSSYILVNSEDSCQLRYAIPNRSEYNDFVKHMRKFVPGGETRPEVFGLDADSSVVRDARNTDEFARALGVLLADNILANDCDYYAAATRDDLSRPSSCTNIVCYFKMEEHGGVEENLRSIVRGIREKLELRVNEEISVDVVDGEYSKKSSSEEPPATVRLVIEEIELYNELVATIRASLIDVERTYNEGLAPLFSTSMATDELARDLLESRVPWTWMNVASEDVASRREQRLTEFIEHLARRRSFLRSWTTAGRRRGSFWLGGIVRRRKFVSAMRLTMARRMDHSVGSLDVDCEVLKMTVDESASWQFVDVDDSRKTSSSSSSSSPDAADPKEETKIQEASVHIHGLFLSGARWDSERSTLVENFPKCYWHAMPVIRFGPRYGRNDDAKQREFISSYTCPVYASYASTIRRDFFYSVSNDCVTSVPLASKDASSDHWIKRAVTLYCNKNE